MLIAYDSQKIILKSWFFSNLIFLTLQKNMKIKILSALFLSISVYAHKHNHSDKNEIRYIKNTRVLNQEYQQFLRQSSLWSNFTQKYNNWYVIFNEGNQLPHRAFGSPIYVDNFIDFLEENNFIIPDDVRVKSTLKSKSIQM